MWALARTAAKRPALMHKMSSLHPGFTACGVDTRGWSKAYFEAPIPQVQCLRCKGITS